MPQTVHKRPGSAGAKDVAGHAAHALKLLLWRNVSALMAQRWGEENLTRLAREAGFGPGTSTRLKEGKTSVGIDVVARCARVFNVEPWELLNPSFEPDRVVECTPHSALAEDVANRLDSIEDDARKRAAHALIVQMVELANPAAKQSP